jgi:peptidoglycan hydrolase-like protein with peptidoglycan-binding domain
MTFGGKYIAGLGLIAVMGVVAPAFAATTPNAMGSGTPVQPGASQPSNTAAMPSDNSQSMRLNSGAGAMSGQSAADTAQTNPSKLSKDQVMAVQQALSVKDDGVWGPETQAALRKYQQQSGLPATGQLDQQTRAKLNVPG